ncbi:MAG: cell division protein ZapA [Pseudomonadota bacterium]
MPEISVEIGGRDFTVACQDGEEPFLKAAAAMLDAEAAGILSQVGRMPTDRMLLMAGLMLADKAAALEEELTSRTAALETAEAKLTDRARQIADLQESRTLEGGATIPPGLRDHLADLAVRAEALADELDAAPGQD